MNSKSIAPSESNLLRVETLATRMTSEEMRAVKAAARDSASSSSEWLREAALAHLRRPNKTFDTSIEMIILEEIMGFRLLMANLFAGANPGVALQTIYQLMANADSVKHEAAEVVRRQASK
jgi:hypothetical protein